MDKQKEQAGAPEQEQRFENEAYDAALQELQFLEEGLDLDKASAETKFHLHEIKRRLKQATNRTYQDAISQVADHFNDADSTYTKHMELMVKSMLEVQRLQNMAIDYGGGDVDIFETMSKSTQEFFFRMSLLLRDLKPIAIDQERMLQRKGSARVVTF